MTLERRNFFYKKRCPGKKESNEPLFYAKMFQPEIDSGKSKYKKKITGAQEQYKGDNIPIVDVNNKNNCIIGSTTVSIKMNQSLTGLRTINFDSSN